MKDTEERPLEMLFMVCLSQILKNLIQYWT